MYEPRKDRQHKLTNKGYDVTQYQDYKGEFCVLMVRPNGKRDLFTFDSKCNANKHYNNLIKWYA